MSQRMAQTDGQPENIMPWLLPARTRDSLLSIPINTCWPFFSCCLPPLISLSVPHKGTESHRHRLTTEESLCGQTYSHFWSMYLSFKTGVLQNACASTHIMVMIARTVNLVSQILINWLSAYHQQLKLYQVLFLLCNATWVRYAVFVFFLLFVAANNCPLYLKLMLTRAVRGNQNNKVPSH